MLTPHTSRTTSHWRSRAAGPAWPAQPPPARPEPTAGSAAAYKPSMHASVWTVLLPLLQVPSPASLQTPCLTT